LNEHRNHAGDSYAHNRKRRGEKKDKTELTHLGALLKEGKKATERIAITSRQ